MGYKGPGMKTVVDVLIIMCWFWLTITSSPRFDPQGEKLLLSVSVWCIYTLIILTQGKQAHTKSFIISYMYSVMNFHELNTPT